MLEKILAKTGIDSFLESHPQVTYFKKIAKKLYKKNKESGLTLMQSQDLIAKENGYNNWHHFFTTIKNQHKQKAGNNVLTTKDLDMDNHYLIGHGTDYSWLSDQQMKDNMLIIGAELYKKYDLLLAKQDIDRGIGFIFMNGTSSSLTNLKDYALKKNKEVQHIDFNIGQGTGFPEIFFNYSQVIYTYLNNYTHNSILTKKQLHDFIYCCVSYLEDTNSQPLTFLELLEGINYQTFLKIFKHNNEKIIKNANNYLSTLEINSKVNLMDFHKSILQEYLEPLEQIKKYSHKFTNDLNLSTIFSIKNDNVCLIDLPMDDKEAMSEFLLAVYQSNLGQSLGTNLDNSDFKDNHSQPNRTFYMRETTVPNITTFCQSKAFGIKLICSYPLASALKDLKDMPILLANCVNKVVDTSKDSHDFNNEQFQISFDAADDIIRIDNPNYVRSIVASRNIKIFMKLEEPTETYNLFKELSSPDKISFEQLETTNNIDAFKNCTKEQANAVLANSNVKIFMKIEPENIIESQNIEKLYQQTLIQPTIFWFYRGETTMQMRL